MYSRKLYDKKMELWGTQTLTEHSCEGLPFRTNYYMPCCTLILLNSISQVISHS